MIGCTACHVTTWYIRTIEQEESQSKLPVHMLAGNFTYGCVVMLFSQVAWKVVSVYTLGCLMAGRCKCMKIFQLTVYVNCEMMFVERIT